jgi:rhodanese-related sulfurtransferase
MIIFIIWGILMKLLILALIMAMLIVPAARSNDLNDSSSYLLNADKFLKGLQENNFYQLSLSDLINITENNSTEWLVLDVRPESMYIKGHVPGSINLPATMLIEKMNVIPLDKKIAVICQLGKTSCLSVPMLRVIEDRDAWNVDGGITAWEAAGKGLEK